MAFLTGMLDNKNQIKKRITAIANCGKNPYRWSVLALIVLMITGLMVLTGAEAKRRVDRVDYPFVNDAQIIGKWQTVDFIRYINDFQSDKKQCKGDLYLKMLYFSSGGQMPPLSITTWTKGLILDKKDKTAGKYLLKEIDGQLYMFFEWKSGDYIDRGMAPWHYVLKKIDSHDYKLAEIPRKTDKVDYPFINDQGLIGKWKIIDVVDRMSQFKPGSQFIKVKLKTKILEFHSNGTTSEPQVIWTKGIVMDRKLKTSSQYQLKTINHSQYMFYKWKGFSYIYLGVEPRYYVLKKIN